MNGEEIRALRRFPEQAVLYRQQPSPLLFLSPLSSFQQCDYDEVNKNIRSAGVRPMTDEASQRRAGREEGEGRATSRRLKNGPLLAAQRTADYVRPPVRGSPRQWCRTVVSSYLLITPVIVRARSLSHSIDQMPRGGGTAAAVASGRAAGALSEV